MLFKITTKDTQLHPEHSVTSLTVRNPGIFCLRDVMIKLPFFWYMVWLIYHLYSISGEIILRQKEISAHFTGSMPCISPTPLSKLLSDFCYSTDSLQGVKPSCQAPTYSSWKLCPGPLSFHSIFACCSLGSQPYKSSSRLQGKKSPFQLLTFADVWICGEDASYLFHSFTSSTSEQIRLVWNTNENHSDNSQFPAGSLLENVKMLFFKKTLSFQSNIFSWHIKLYSDYFFKIIWAEKTIQ